MFYSQFHWVQKLLYFILALFVLYLDQLSKQVILKWDAAGQLPMQVNPYLDFEMIWNKGITFGIMSERYSELSRYGFVIAASIAVLILLSILVRSKSQLVMFCTAIISGGAAGNILDRARFGGVVDFIHCHIASYSWYVFNVGDSFIVIGVILWILKSTFFSNDDGVTADFLNPGALK